MRTFREHGGRYFCGNKGGTGIFVFNRRGVNKFGVRVSCTSEKRGCPVRALLDERGTFLKYLRQEAQVHNHSPPVSQRASSPPNATFMTKAHGRRFDKFCYQCPQNFMFYVQKNYTVKTTGQERRSLRCASHRQVGLKKENARYICEQNRKIGRTEKNDLTFTGLPRTCCDFAKCSDPQHIRWP